MSARPHRWRWLAAVAAMLVLCLWAVSQAAHFLGAPALPPAPADLLVVPGGDVGDRGLATAQLYKTGMAPRVLLTGMEGSPAAVKPTYLHWRVQMLTDAGVPRERIEVDAESRNSWEEAINTRRLMEARGWRRVLVVSDPYHMRRLSWAWHRVFEGSGLEYSLASSAPEYWKADVWWRDEKSGQAVIVEYIKLVYYLAKY